MDATAPTSLADLRRGLHTSVSQIKAYLMCPAKVFHQYVRGTPPSHRSVALAFGSAVHHALELFYAKLKTDGCKPPLEEIQAAFADRWSIELADDLPILFDDGQDAGQAQDQGVALVGAFHAQGFVPDEVVAVEQAFAVDLADPETGKVLDIPLIGAIDLVAVHEGRAVFVEHKTAARRFDATRLAFDPQPTTYQYASRSLNINNPKLVFQMLLKQKRPVVETVAVTRSHEAQNEMLHTFVHVLKGIEAGVFPRNRGWACADRQYRHRCG